PPLPRWTSLVALPGLTALGGLSLNVLPSRITSRCYARTINPSALRMAIEGAGSRPQAPACAPQNFAGEPETRREHRRARVGSPRRKSPLAHPYPSRSEPD